MYKVIENHLHFFTNRFIIPFAKKKGCKTVRYTPLFRVMEIHRIWEVTATPWERKVPTWARRLACSRTIRGERINKILSVRPLRADFFCASNSHVTLDLRKSHACMRIFQSNVTRWMHVYEQNKVAKRRRTERAVLWMCIRELCKHETYRKYYTKRGKSWHIIYLHPNP